MGLVFLHSPGFPIVLFFTSGQPIPRISGLSAFRQTDVPIFSVSMIHAVPNLFSSKNMNGKHT
jgi:hypothetical protein